MRIRINEQWRICFRWIDHDAWDVEIVDYFEAILEYERSYISHWKKSS